MKAIAVKRTLKRAGGAVAIAVGLTGAVLSVLAVVQTWSTAGRLSREIPPALAGLEGILDSVQQQGTTTIALLETARQHTASVRTSVGELSSRAGEQPAASILDTLDEQVLRRLESAEEFVLSMQVSMRSTASALLVLDSLPFFGPLIAPAGDPRAGQLKSVAASLAETADLLEQVGRTIARIRSGQEVGRAQLVQVRETLGRVDRRLDEVQSEIRALSARVEQTRARLSAVKDDVPRWINTVAVVTTVFLVCFGFSQLSVLLHGWQIVRS